MHAQWQPFASDHLTAPKVNDGYARSVQPFPDILLLICDVLKLKLQHKSRVILRFVEH